MQWADFSYSLPGDEYLAEVQERNIAALNNVLDMYKNKNNVVGTRGIALSTIINFYDKSFGFNDLMTLVFLITTEKII